MEMRVRRYGGWVVVRTLYVSDIGNGHSAPKMDTPMAIVTWHGDTTFRISKRV